MNSAKLKETIANIVKEESEYQIFFRKALEKAGKSITDMNDEEKKAFFNKIDSTWDGKGEKNEGNAFGAAVVAAKKAGEDEFEVGGKTFKVEESVNEEVYAQKIKFVMQNSTSSFKNLGNDFKKAGLKYNFSTTPFPHYIVEPGGNKKVAIVSRKNEYDLKGSGIQYSTYIATMKESVNEGVSPADMDKIKGAVEAASSFMSVGSELKKLGMKYTFATEPLPIYIIQPTPNNKVAIVNKKYATKPDFVVGDIAVGIMEGKLNEEEIKWDAVENAIINFLKMNTKILDKRVQAKDTNGVKGGLKSIISGLVNAQRNLKLESVNEAGYTVKAENPYQFVNGAYAVLSAYLKDEELGPKGKRELQDIIKSLDYMRKYFYFKMSESVQSVNEEKYTVIDPMGNQKGVGPKIQAISMAKRLGGEKTGHFVVANTNALKARRALEKFKGDFKNPKLKDMMMNLYYESVNERIVKEKVK